MILENMKDFFKYIFKEYIIENLFFYLQIFSQALFFAALLFESMNLNFE